MEHTKLVDLGEIAVIIAAWINPAFGATGGPLNLNSQ